MSKKGRNKERSQTRKQRIEAARAARRRKERVLAIGIPVALVAVAVAVAAVLTGSGTDTGSGPSAAGAVKTSGEPRSTMLAAGEAIPDFTAPRMGGGTLSWEEYKGTPTVLAIWAPWCPHCQAEMPVIGRVSRDYPDVPVVTIATAIGAQPGPSPEKFMAERKLSFPVGLDDENATLSNALGVQGFPTTYFVGADGTVVGAFNGETPEEDLRNAYDAIVATSKTGA